MLTPELLNAVKSYTANLTDTVTLVLQTGEHSKRDELVKFLSDFCSVSDKLHVEERDDASLRSAMSFLLEVNGESTGVQFSGIPGGHEFNSLVLAVLNAAGTPIKLDDSIQNIIKNVHTELKFETYIGLSCHNCPDVVQSLNQFSLLNDNVSNEMIDGAIYPALVDEKNIQGVPTVYLNGEVFATGKIDTAQLLDKLMTKYPDLANASNTDTLPLQDVTVIGGGPAGVAAAIYSARKGLKVTMIADRFGGQVKDTMGIENLISVQKTTGPELTNNLLSHLQDYEITQREHLRVDKVEAGNIKTVTLSSGEIIKTKSLIVATGAKWRELGVPGEKENIGNGVAYCPHCDGPFFKGKDVAVIGGGNSGIEAAIDLAGIVKSVTVFEFMPELKADQVLIDQAEKRDNITILKNVATNQILAQDGKVSAIEYTHRETNEVTQLNLAGVFVQIGLVPNSQFIEGVVETTQYGEIIINEKGQTNQAGIFAAGDVTTVPYKQIVVAMGEGSKASLAAFDYLITHDENAEQDSTTVKAVA
ncbi:MAG: alkyl hydroperoxide reductase subunit F [Arenicella sp.]